MPKRKINQEDEEVSTSGYLYVGVYLIILSFFILLSTYTTFEKKKVIAVLDSLSEQFDQYYDKDQEPGVFDNQLYLYGEVEQFYKTILNYAQLYLKLTSYQYREKEKVLELRMPLSLYDNDKAFQRQLNSFSKRLINYLGEVKHLHDTDLFIDFPKKSFSNPQIQKKLFSRVDGILKTLHQFFPRDNIYLKFTDISKDQWGIELHLQHDGEKNGERE